MATAKPRVICARSALDIEEEMERLGADRDGIAKMLPTSVLHAVKLPGLSGPVARELKSLALRAGGEVAIASDIYFGKDGDTDALLWGTPAGIERLCAALRASRPELAQVGGLIEDALRAFYGGRGITKCRGTVFEWGSRTYIMGIINVTPDSFSLDGLGDDVEAALQLGRRMVAEGADVVDVGGESTRPGHTPISAEEEIRRVLPVIRALAHDLPVPVSIDTHKAEVARQAVLAGASMVNDIWGLRADPEMAAVVAQADVPVVLMHNQHGTHYRSLMDDIVSALGESIDLALKAGVKWDNIIIDPGIGFGKTWQQNLKVLARLAELKSLGRPILLGTSRKSTIGRVLDLPVDQRLEGTAATVAIGICNGADLVRVHDVKEMVRVARMTDAVVRGRWAESS